MCTLPAAGSSPPGPPGVDVLSGTCCLAAQSELPRARCSCPRRPWRIPPDLAPRRIEAAPPAPRPREAGDEPALYRITNTSEDNGGRPGRLHRRLGDACASANEDDIHLER